MTDCIATNIYAVSRFEHLTNIPQISDERSFFSGNSCFFKKGLQVFLPNGSFREISCETKNRPPKRSVFRMKSQKGLFRYDWRNSILLRRLFEPPFIAARKKNMIRMPTGSEMQALIISEPVARSIDDAIRYVMPEITAQDSA